VPAFRVFGDPDDALRLTVLLADRLGPDAPSAREEASVCKTSKIPWEQRLDALERLLDRTTQPSGRPYLGALIDLDALYPGQLSGKRMWKDRGFNTHRSAVFEVLCDAIDRGGWLVLRPSPREEVSERLLRCGRSTEKEQATTESTDPLALVSGGIGADLRPVLVWLVREKAAIAAEDARDILDARGPEGLEAYALTLTYELLKPSVQSAGQRLSALRGPQPVNGLIGGFRLVPDALPLASGATAAEVLERVMEEPSIGEAAIVELRACGFLQPVDPSRGDSLLQMPTPIRTFLRRLSRLEEPYRWSRDNRELGKKPLHALDVEAQLEVHHHAIEGEDIEDARRTALYYGADLRGLAFRMSREKQFSGAARVYQMIIQDFDAEDDYAWEYLGYNLAREVDRRVREGGAPLTPEERVQISKAYEAAASKAKTNPLYDGRWLGFRAELGAPGERVRVEFNERMRYYQHNSRWKQTAMGYFAKAALDGLIRGGRITERDELYRRWRKYLDGNPYFRETS